MKKQPRHRTAIPKATSIYYSGTIEQWYTIETKSQYSFSSDNYGVHCSNADFYPSGTCGEDLIWEFNDITGTLTISGTGDMVNYENRGDALDYNPYQMFCFRTNKIVLSEGVTSIGGYAFYNFNNFIKIVIPDSVTTISSTAFVDFSLYCYPLSVYYSGTMEQWRIFEKEFDYRYTNNFNVYCSNGRLPISGSCGEHLEWEFDEITGTLTVSGYGEMSNFNPDYNESPWSTSRISGYIKNVVIGNEVESIGEFAFSNCDDLESIIIPQGVVSIEDYAFKSCLNLENITIPVSVKKIKGNSLPVLVTINYMGSKEQWRSFEKENDYCFTEYRRAYCLDGELLPSGPCGKNLMWSFDDNTGVLSFFGAGDMDDQLTIEGYFTYFHQSWQPFCEFIRHIDFNGDISSIGAGAFWYCNNLESIAIPKTVTKIGQSAFENCTALSSVVIYDGVTSIGEAAFTSCKNLTCVSYMGSQEQWEAISIERYNGLLNGKVHFKCQKTDVPPTCIKHGITNYTCECCGVYYWEYSSNPTSHSINADGVCENCGKQEAVNNTASNNQLLSFDSILQLIVNLINNLFNAVLKV